MMLFLRTFFISLFLFTFLQSSEVEKQVTVIATKTEKYVFDVAGQSYDIKSNTVTNQTSNVFDMFQNNASISLGGSARNNGKGLVLRGYGPFSNLNLIDGVRQNFYSAHDGLLFLHSGLLSGADVSLGSVSALYGNGGLSGVVNYKTISAQDFLKDTIGSGIYFNQLYDSENNGFETSSAVYGAGENYDYLVGFAYLNSSDIRLSKNNKLEASDKSYSTLAKFSYDLNDNNRLAFENMTYSARVKEPNNPQAVAKPDLVMLNYNVRKDIYFINTVAKYYYDNGFYNNQVKVYYTNTSLDELTLENKSLSMGPSVIPLAVSSDVAKRKITTMGINQEGSFNLKYSDNGNSILSYGFEAYQDKQDGGFNQVERGGAPDAKATYTGAYLQGDTSVYKFNLIYGLRYDSYSSKSNSGLNNKDAAVSPKLSFNYMPTNDIRLFVNYGFGFRAPSLTEIYTTDQHFPGNNFVPNPDLKPEKNQTAETGFGIRGDNYQFKTSFYYTTTTNYIDLLVQRTTTQFVNIAKANIYGVDSSLDLYFGNFTANLSYAYSNGKDTNTKKYLTTIMPHTFVSNLSYALNKQALVGYRMTAASRVTRRNVEYNSTTRVYERQPDIAGYVTHDIYAGYNITDKISFSAGINNLLDKKYSNVPFVGISELDTIAPGRSYNANVKVVW